MKSSLNQVHQSSMVKPYLDHDCHNVFCKYNTHWLYMYCIGYTRKKLPSSEIGSTALVWTTTLTLTYDVDLQFSASYGHDLLYAKVQGQRSVHSEGRVETNGRSDKRMDGQTDGSDCITGLANAVGNINRNARYFSKYTVSRKTSPFLLLR